MSKVKYPCPDVCWAKGVENNTLEIGDNFQKHIIGRIEKIIGSFLFFEFFGCWEKGFRFFFIRTEWIFLNRRKQILMKISFFFKFKNCNWFLKTSHSLTNKKAVMQQLVGGFRDGIFEYVNNCMFIWSVKFGLPEKSWWYGCDVSKEMFDCQVDNEKTESPLSSSQWNGNDMISLYPADVVFQMDFFAGAANLLKSNAGVQS